MEERIKQLEMTVKQLTDFMNALGNQATMPFEVEGAMRRRLKIVSPSTKTAASETQAVDEGGTAEYSVAKAMDGFIQVTDVNGQIKNVGYYD